jgi:deoxyribodipyrimidine photo-lyase
MSTEEKQDMRRDFSGREELVAYLRAEFPQAAAIDDHVSPILGGRQAAEDTLAAMDPAAYARSRNYLDGAVTRLSPYLRHGVLSMAEVRDAARTGTGRNPGKLVQELGWRDYYQRVYAQIGDDIWTDREAYKTGFTAAEYADELPPEIPAGETGLACMDAFSRELAETGYLHNHARMWVAGYVVHWRRVKWQAGAHWFLQHLLDGDPASNNLSWQWVASTFSHKPYFYNRENVEKFTAGRYCRDCPLYGACAFEGSYPALEKQLFPQKPPEPPRPKGRRQRKKGRGQRR